MLRMHAGEVAQSVVTAEMFTRTRNAVSRNVAGETLVVPIRGKVGELASIYSFNDVGSLIWGLLETPKHLSELTEAVVQTFSVRMERAAEDVAQFLNEMLAVGLVETAGGTPASQGPVGRVGLEAAGAL